MPVVATRLPQQTRRYLDWYAIQLGPGVTPAAIVRAAIEEYLTARGVPVETSHDLPRAPSDLPKHWPTEAP